MCGPRTGRVESTEEVSQRQYYNATNYIVCKFKDLYPHLPNLKKIRLWEHSVGKNNE